MGILNLKSGLLLLAIGSLSACGGGGSGSSDPNDNTYYLDGVKVEINDVVASAKYKVGFGGNGSATINGTYTSIASLTASANGTTAPLGTTQTGSTTINSDGTWYDTDGTSGTWTKEDNNVYFVGSGNVQGVNVNTSATIALGETTTYYNTVYIEGLAVTGEVTVDATELPDFNVVDGSRGDFFITDIGTGTQSYLTNEQSEILNEFHADFQERGGNYAAFSDDLAAAHADGWTGSGIQLILNAEDDLVFDLIPNADHRVWTEDYDASAVINLNTGEDIYVSSFGSASLEGYYIDELTEKSHSIVAAGVGTVWNKFDTLAGNQILDVVTATSDGNRFDLGAALSPVGNLN